MTVSQSAESLKRTIARLKNRLAVEKMDFRERATVESRIKFLEGQLNEKRSVKAQIRPFTGGK